MDAMGRMPALPGLRAHVVAGQIFHLLRRQRVDAYAHRLQLEFRDPGVDFGGDVVDLGLQGGLVLQGPLGS